MLKTEIEWFTPEEKTPLESVNFFAITKKLGCVCAYISDRSEYHKEKYPHGEMIVSGWQYEDMDFSSENVIMWAYLPARKYVKDIYCLDYGYEIYGKNNKNEVKVCELATDEEAFSRLLEEAEKMLRESNACESDILSLKEEDDVIVNKKVYTNDGDFFIANGRFSRYDEKKYLEVMCDKERYWWRIRRQTVPANYTLNSNWVMKYRQTER